MQIEGEPTVRLPLDRVCAWAGRGSGTVGQMPLRYRRRRLGLRARAAMSFSLVGFTAALAVAASGWFLTRAYLLDEREQTATRQLYADARLVRAGLRTPDVDIATLLDSVGAGTSSQLVLERDGERFATGVQQPGDLVPAGLRSVVGEDGAGVQRHRGPDDELYVTVGVALPAVDASLYEIVPLEELQQTLGTVRRSLVAGVLAATMVAAVAGHRLAAGLNRPITEIGAAARGIAGGDLGTRLGSDVDPDLRELAEAFDDMAAEVEGRIQRDIRFAADVGHELRSPLAAISAAIEVIDRRREELSGTVASAFDVLAERVHSMAGALEELLELSRLDAGEVALRLEPLDVERFCDELVRLRDLPHLDVVVAPGLHVLADRRRLAQIVGNLLDNATNYAGGPTRLVASPAPGGRIRFAVEDAGPGVSPEERGSIFNRFSRGAAGVAAGAGSGTGLGLSLVAEHVALHGGRVWVEDVDTGGARFVVELLAEREAP